jgi:hypothetical protein
MHRRAPGSLGHHILALAQGVESSNTSQTGEIDASEMMRALMSSTRFGIIRVPPSGIPQWIEAVKGLAEAKAYLLRLASRETGEFFIYSEKSGTIVERLVCLEDEELLDNKPKPKTQPRRFHYLS